MGLTTIRISIINMILIIITDNRTILTKLIISIVRVSIIIIAIITAVIVVVIIAICVITMFCCYCSCSRCHSRDSYRYNAITTSDKMFMTVLDKVMIMLTKINMDTADAFARSSDFEASQ